MHPPAQRAPKSNINHPRMLLSRFVPFSESNRILFDRPDDMALPPIGSKANSSAISLLIPLANEFNDGNALPISLIRHT